MKYLQRTSITWFFAILAVLMLAGCGSDFEWFPDRELFPTITSFSPSNALPGTEVTIEGTDFSTTPASNIVKFNGVATVVTKASSSRIVASVPTGATSGPITVTVGKNTAISKTDFIVTRLLGGAVQGQALSLANMVTTLAGTAGSAGAVDAVGVAARFDAPGGITTDGTNLYIADANNNTIRKVVIATRAVSTLAGTAGTTGSDDGSGVAARFDFPGGITTDGTNLYVADSNNNTIRKIVIATGDVSTLAGTAGNIGPDDGTGAAASFNFPTGITTDGTYLYIADSGNNVIRKIVIATGEVSTLAGTAETYGADDGVGAAARFDFPSGITTDGTCLYVADTANSTIRKIVIATAAVSTLAGTAGNYGADDGAGAAASFNFPGGITTDGTSLYVVDSDNSIIRKIVIASGDVATLAGTAGNNGADDGTGAAASFNFPDSITTDGTNLYLSDTENSTIRKIQ